ncbi:MAG TPA: hypothetical protein VJH34_04510 [archaeon]|nr:hypothetical protein [archaeon]
MQKKVLILFLASIVILSGCTSAGNKSTATTSANGVIVTKFAPDFNEIASGDSATLSLSIQNVGGAEATNLQAQLFGGIGVGTGWAVTPVAATVDIKPSILKPTDTVNNLPGENADSEWQLTSPSDLKTTTSYTAGVRVYYDYGTHSSATLRFFSNNYLKTLPTAQYQSLIKTAGVVSQSSSSGPVSISYSSGSRPLVVSTGAGTFSMQVTFNNVGNGNTYDLNATTESNLNLVSYKLIPRGDLTITCPDGDGISPDVTWTKDSTTTDTVKLSGGKTKVLFCQITNPGDTGVDNTKDYSIDVEATYGYFVESQTAINVLAAPQ